MWYVPINSGLYLLYISIIYLTVGLLNIKFEWAPSEYIQIVWIMFLAAPVTIPSVSRWVGVQTVWEDIKV